MRPSSKSSQGNSDKQLGDVVKCASSVMYMAALANQLQSQRGARNTTDASSTSFLDQEDDSMSESFPVVGGGGGGDDDDSDLVVGAPLTTQSIQDEDKNSHRPSSSCASSTASAANEEMAAGCTLQAALLMKPSTNNDDGPILTTVASSQVRDRKPSSSSSSSTSSESRNPSTARGQHHTGGEDSPSSVTWNGDGAGAGGVILAASPAIAVTPDSMMGASVLSVTPPVANHLLFKRVEDFGYSSDECLTPIGAGHRRRNSGNPARSASSTTNETNSTVATSNLRKPSSDTLSCSKEFAGPEKVEQDDDGCVNAAEKVYDTVKNVWGWGKEHIILARPLLGLAEGVAGKVVEIVGSNLHDVDGAVADKLQGLDRQILNPAIAAVVKMVMGATNGDMKDESLLKSLLSTLLKPVGLLIRNHPETSGKQIRPPAGVRARISQV